ncbi:hypothetical protein BDI4_230049 [Burkholderia diffusa]|nr:hypothetical protein BDI4_230049 [Burkholderia diffusa]
MGARSHAGRFRDFRNHFRREHAAHARWHSRDALAPAGRVGDHARRPLPHHRARRAGAAVGAGRENGRSLVFPARPPAFAAGHRHRWRRISARIRQRSRIGIQHTAADRLGRAYAARRARAQLRRGGRRIQEHSARQPVDLPGGRARAARGRAAGIRFVGRHAAASVHLLARRHEAVQEDARRRSADCRQHEFRRVEDGRGGARHRASGRHARTALASECGRMAVLPAGRGADDRVRHGAEGADGGFSPGRRRLREEESRALRAEHRQHRSRVSRDLQDGPLRGGVAVRLARAHAAEARRGAPEHRARRARAFSAQPSRRRAAVTPPPRPRPVAAADIKESFTLRTEPDHDSRPEQIRRRSRAVRPVHRA